MSSPAFQNSAQELHAKLEGSARLVLDEVDKTMLRTIAHSSSKCVVACFDKAGKTGSSEELDHCSRKCQIPYQQATNLVQNETSQFQNRLGRAMMDCQDQAKDLLTPGQEPSPAQMAKIEAHLIKCMGKTVDEHIKMLKPMKDRIQGMLKQL